MRNKKLISMLMLSAGFVACTDEMVENNSVNYESQEGLIEDVVLNVSLGEDALTRAAYAGGYKEYDKDENPVNFSVFRHFYLEPEWTYKTVTVDGNEVTTISGWEVSDNEKLAGDMLGLCLINGSAAVTNYPFYIAGYHSADNVEETEDGQVTTPGKVYVLDDDNSLYNLTLRPGQESKLATVDGLTASISAVAGKVSNEALEAHALDIRQGIVRTNSGIMSGKYTAYFPYNEGWTNPSGIPLKGKKAMTDLFELESLPKSHAAAVEAVGFNDYLMAVSKNYIDIEGGTRAGDINISPVTSALTFVLTNSGDEETDEIKRVTIRSKEAGAEAFILDGSVEVPNMSGIKATKTTDLIGASFPATKLGAATVDNPETKDVDESSTDTRYVTIPFFANPAVTEWVIEIYNTKGQVAQIEKTVSFGIGEAPKTTIDLADENVNFEDAVRKIFDADDFMAEVIAGGTLELMKDGIQVWLDEDVTIEKDLEIIGHGYQLNFMQDDDAPYVLDVDITMDKGILNLGTATESDVTVTGDVVMMNNAGIKAAVKANVVRLADSNEGTAYTYNQLIEAGTLTVLNSPVVTLKYAKFDNAEIDLGTVTLDGEWVAKEGKWHNVEVTNTLTVGNQGKLIAKNLSVGTLINKNEVEVNGTLNATTITNSYKNDWNGTNNFQNGAEFTVTSVSGSACTFTNEHWGAELNWNASQLNWTINNNSGKMIIKKNVTLGESGKIVNKATLTQDGEIALRGTIENYTIWAINKNISVQAGEIKLQGGTATVAQDADLNGNSSLMTIGSGANFEKVASKTALEFYNEVTGGTNFEKKYTAVIVQDNIGGENNTLNVFSTDKKLVLKTGTNLTLPEGTELADVVVLGSNTAVLKAPNASVKSITINQGGKLELVDYSYINVEGAVTNNGTYDGVNSTVNCSTFNGYGSWTNNWTPNC